MTYPTLFVISDILEDERLRANKQYKAALEARNKAYKEYDKYRNEHPDAYNQSHDLFFGSAVSDEILTKLYRRWSKLEEICRKCEAKYQQLDKALDEFHHQDW